MKTLLLVLTLAAAAMAEETNCVCKDTRPVHLPEDAVQKASKDFDWSVGGDLRIRQEIMDNIPGHPNEPGSIYAAKSGKNLNWFRIRPRAWTRFGTQDASLYFRVADEMREYVVDNGKPRDKRSYNEPDELIVDNLYLDLKNLLDDRLDLRIGRQDFMDNGCPSFGSGRTLLDGSPYDGSRSAFFDAIRATWHFTDKTTLDAFAIYNNGENEAKWGHPTPDPRPNNAIDPRDSTEMDEFGGGLYLKSHEFSDDLPFELYYIYKRETSYHLKGVRMPGRYVNTWGGRVMPKFTETLTGEFEAAGQAGEKDNGASTAGAMGFAGVRYSPKTEFFGTAKPFLKTSCYYLSGDRKRTDANDRDTCWDPLWARWPQDSEMLVYGPLYGLGYWSNMIYLSAGGGLDISKRQKLNFYAGPMFSAVQDGLGGGDSSYEGALGVIRYDFPIWKNKNEGGLGELYGHVMAEGFQPGDYYESDRTAYFFRWEVTARF